MTTINLWKGKFGDDYRERNKITDQVINSRISMWGSILDNIGKQGTFTKEQASSGYNTKILEVGCGNGANLIALGKLANKQDPEKTIFYALEPNETTAMECATNHLLYSISPPVFFKGDACNIECASSSMDLVFTSGVLIHIPPDKLLNAMKEIFRTSNKFIVCAEYFSPELREHNYHGEPAMWTNDFGSIWLDNFPVRCLGVTFLWKRLTGLDNLMVWVFEKVN